MMLLARKFYLIKTVINIGVYIDVDWASVTNEWSLFICFTFVGCNLFVNRSKEIKYDH